eukprot:1311555-Prymnesium_polylepis.1
MLHDVPRSAPFCAHRPVSRLVPLALERSCQLPYTHPIGSRSARRGVHSWYCTRASLDAAVY